MPQRVAARANSQIYLIVDLEATCWKGTQPGQTETIEIGAVLYEQGKGIVTEFQSFVRPKLWPELSDFCKQLTHIRQEDVDSAPTFPEAFRKFLDWAEPYPSAAFTSWGAYDRKQLLMDCLLHQMEPWERLDPHINLKRAFSALMDCSLAPELSHALELSKIAGRGNLHRGLDDARNIAQVLEHLLTKFSPERLKSNAM
ncbi:MAG: exonuclease domain-containing protein [Candidatus Sumerlaeaceae bacterium]